jgi:hypothetical protein
MKQAQLEARVGRLDPELERQLEDALARMKTYEMRREKHAEPPPGMVPVLALKLSKRTGVAA